MDTSGLALELRRGVVVLAALSQLRTPRYGYELRQALAENGMTVEEGTLYPLLLRRVDLTLEIGVVLVLAWFVAAGRVMQAALPNQVASNLIGVIAVLMCIEIGVKLYRGLDPFSAAQGRHADASLREGHS